MTAFAIDGLQNRNERLDERRGTSSCRQTLLHLANSPTVHGDQVLSGSQHRQCVAGLTVDNDAAHPRLSNSIDESVDGGKAGADVIEVGARHVQS